MIEGNNGGVFDTTITGCRFQRLGGNALFVSRGVKGTNVTRNHFALIGDSAIATVGELELSDGVSVSSYPADTTITNNHIRGVGIAGKQSSAWFSALSCRTMFKGNVLYNGPRAGVNLNDGFCGGETIESNIFFNWVRETQDHGPINTWDRAMYMQPSPSSSSSPLNSSGSGSGSGSGGVGSNSDGGGDGNGGITTTKAWTHISNNLIYNGPSGNRDLGNMFPAIDNDDGSSMFLAHGNVMVYGGAKNYLGHDKIWDSNLIAYPDRWGGDPCVQSWGGPNHIYSNNTCMVGCGRKRTGGGGGDAGTGPVTCADPVGIDGTSKGFVCKVDFNNETNRYRCRYGCRCRRRCRCRCRCRCR
jgi:hypothetical protein